MNEEKRLGYYTIFLLLSSLVRSFMLRDSHGCPSRLSRLFSEKGWDRGYVVVVFPFPKVSFFVKNQSCSFVNNQNTF